MLNGGRSLKYMFGQVFFTFSLSMLPPCFHQYLPGRAELCRQRGLAYQAFEKNTGLALAVAEAHCRYHSPALYDEVLIIRTRVQTLRKRMIVFEYEVSKQGSELLVATGSTSHVVIDKNGRPRSFTPEYLRFYQ